MSFSLATWLLIFIPMPLIIILSLVSYLKYNNKLKNSNARL